MSKTVYLTFHFVSGKSVHCHFSEKKFNDLLNCLKQGWKTTATIGDDLGINFALVTHYEVNEIREEV